MIRIGKEYNKKYAEISIAGRMWVIDADADENLGGLSRIANIVADEEQKKFEQIYSKATKNLDTASLESSEFIADIKKSCAKIQKLLNGILSKPIKCYDEDAPDAAVDNSNPSAFIFSNISATWSNHCSVLALVSHEVSEIIKMNAVDAKLINPTITEKTHENAESAS